MWGELLTLFEYVKTDQFLAHFSLGAYANKQNCRIWGSENPKVIAERPLHPEKVTVW